MSHIGCEDDGVLNKFNSYSADVFKLKDLGAQKYFLGYRLLGQLKGLF